MRKWLAKTASIRADRNGRVRPPEPEFLERSGRWRPSLLYPAFPIESAVVLVFGSAAPASESPVSGGEADLAAARSDFRV
jgi:hypothetical protein